MTPEPRCRACQKSSAEIVDSTKFLVCSRCQTMTRGQRKTYYCSKSCQTLDWPLHKPTICGQPLEPPRPPRQGEQAEAATTTTTTTDLSTLDTSLASPALVFHLAALKTLASQLSKSPASSPAFSSSSSSTPTPLHPVPAYLFFPTDPLVASSSSSSSRDRSALPIPIHLSPPSHQLFTVLFHTAISSSNALSITLMYSLLITSVEALEGGHQRLIDQLAQEFPRVDVKTELEIDREPDEQELRDAIGGEHNLPLLR